MYLVVFSSRMCFSNCQKVHFKIWLIIALSKFKVKSSSSHSSHSSWKKNKRWYHKKEQHFLEWGCLSSLLKLTQRQRAIFCFTPEGCSNFHLKTKTGRSSNWADVFEIIKLIKFLKHFYSVEDQAFGLKLCWNFLWKSDVDQHTVIKA